MKITIELMTEVESWKDCLARQKFWILYERMNQHHMGFRDFLHEIAKLYKQYDNEHKLLVILLNWKKLGPLENELNEKGPKDSMAIQFHLSKKIVEKLIKVALVPNEELRELYREKVIPLVKCKDCEHLWLNDKEEPYCDLARPTSFLDDHSPNKERKCKYFEREGWGE